MPYTRKSELFSGIKAELPITLSVIPFGLIFGVLVTSAGVPPLLGQSMSSIIFAGSAQFIAAQLIGSGASIPILWLTIFFVNIRHLLYSTSLAPYVGHLSAGWKALLAYLLTDEAYVVSILHYDDQEIPLHFKHWFFLGSGLTLWTVWQLSTAAGIFLGAQIPSSWSLDFTLALTFIGMLIPSLKTSPVIAAALVAGIVALLTFNLPYNLYLVLAALAGISAGTILENRRK